MDSPVSEDLSEDLQEEEEEEPTTGKDDKPNMPLLPTPYYTETTAAQRKAALSGKEFLKCCIAFLLTFIRERPIYEQAAWYTAWLLCFYGVYHVMLLMFTPMVTTTTPWDITMTKLLHIKDILLHG